MKLKYGGLDLGVECNGGSECQCEFCGGLDFLIRLLAKNLEICIENQLVSHHNFIVKNLDYLLAQAAEQLGDSRVLH